MSILELALTQPADHLGFQTSRSSFPLSFSAFRSPHGNITFFKKSNTQSCCNKYDDIFHVVEFGHRGSRERGFSQHPASVLH